MISFTCNICSTANTVDDIPWETATCTGCASNVRMRDLIYMLALELFGEALPLPDFPQCDDVKAFGMSDALIYATALAEKVNYTNTFYDRQPYLDITEPHPDEHGTYDFILSSDVFEHVAPPIDRAFEEAFRLLKPHGFLCVTVPSSHLADETVEHYPDLSQYAVVELAGEHVLVNRKADKTLEIHSNLDFHGGIGATLVMRLFSMKDLERRLRAAGFTEVEFQVEPVERLGIVFEGPWSRPFVARKQPFPKISASARPLKKERVSRHAPQVAPAPGAHSPVAQLYNEKAALEERLEKVETQLRMAADSRWLKLGRRMGLGPNLKPEK